MGLISLSLMERVGSGSDFRSWKRLAREARASSRGELRFRSTHGGVGFGKVEGGNGGVPQISSEIAWKKHENLNFFFMVEFSSSMKDQLFASKQRYDLNPSACNGVSAVATKQPHRSL